MAKGAISVSVVVPAYNAAHTMAECMGALNNQTVPLDTYEVIVVDDGSTDDTAHIATSLGAKVLRQANSGPAVARNKGIAVAQGDVILFTDADCAPAPDWIQQMLAPLASPEITGVKGAYRTKQKNWTARFIQLEYEDRYDLTARRKYIDFIDTYAAGYRREALQAIGGFDVQFPYASVEDQELSFRMAEAQYRMVFNPHAVVYHYHPESWSRYARRKYKIGYWKTLVLRLHPGKAWRDSHTPGDVKLQLGLAAATAPLVLLAPLSRACAILLAAIVATFVVSALPFLVKAWRRDWPMAILALPALYVRAWALGLGLVAGWWNGLRNAGALSSPQVR